MEQYVLDNDFQSSFEEGARPTLAFLYKIDCHASSKLRAMHSHEDVVEIVLVNKGCAVFTIDGNPYSVQAGDVLVYNSNVVHEECLGMESGIEHFCCGIKNVQVKGLRQNALIAEGAPPVFACGGRYETVRSIMNVLFLRLGSRGVHAQESCQYMILALIATLLDITEPQAKKESSAGLRQSLLATCAKNYIDEHYSEDLTLQSIADALNVSVYHMSHVFKKETGFSPLQYVARRRVGEAQSLLIETNLSATEIGSMVGFGNPSHFNAMFKKRVGLSPLKYPSHKCGSRS